MHDCNLLKLNYVCTGNTQVKLCTSRLIMFPLTEKLTQVKRLRTVNYINQKLQGTMNGY